MNVHNYQYIFMSCCLFWLITRNSLYGVNFAFNSVYYAKYPESKCVEINICLKFKVVKCLAVCRATF